MSAAATRTTATRTIAVRFLLAAALVGGLALPPGPAHALSLGGLFGSGVDPELVAQVPQGQRAEINRADFALACANQDIELAKLKEELADRQDDLASQNTKLAKAAGKGAEIDLNIAKMEAVIKAGLGKREETQKVLDALRADKVKNDSERIGLKAKLDQNVLFVRDYTERVAAKEKSVAAFKARSSVAPAAAPAASPAAPAAPKPDAAKPDAADPVVIINAEPGAPAQAVSATPESDLKN